MKATVVTRPAGQRAPAHYLANRAPLTPSQLLKLPLGQVQPEGWLRHQLDLMAQGMTGRLGELSAFLAPENGWLGGDGEGWEEQGYWLRGFYDLAALTGDRTLRAEAGRWMEAILGSQDPEGYFGARAHRLVRGQKGQELVDLWPHMVMLDAVIHHHEATGDARVLPFMERFFAFCSQIPEAQFIQPLQEGFGDWKPTIQRDRAGDMIPHLHWLYNHTGDPALLALATRFFHHIRPPHGEWLDNHVVNFTQRFSYPGLYYAQSGDPRLLAQSEYWYQQHLGTWGQQPRGIFGADELIRPGCVDPRQAIETCAMVEFNKSFYHLGRVTGNPLWADRCEDVTLNHFPASSTPDLKGLHYLTASNQPQLDASGEHHYCNQGRQIDYSPHLYRCCQHNVAMGWPWYAQHLWLASPDQGLVAWLYAACRVRARVGAYAEEVQLRVHTDYPFGGEVEIEVGCSRPVEFPLYLRVPRWCRAFQVTVGGKRLDLCPDPGTYVRLSRRWVPGDRVLVNMPMELALSTWPRNGSVTVDRGPLSYSLAIGEQWRRCGGTDPWPEWEVLPTTPWNYGLVLDPAHPLSGFEVRRRGPVPEQPWTPEGAPLEIRAHGKRIPGWKLERETVQELRQSPVYSDQPEEQITLIPLGCARLRLACLPVIGEGAAARPWAG